MEETLSSIKVFVIIPCFNAEKYIEKCVLSIFNSAHHVNVQIFVNIIDDGSTDNSRQIILDLVKRFPKNIFYHFNDENKGASFARNVGLKMIECDGYVLFVDADDYIGKNYIDYLLGHILKSKSQITMFSCGVVQILCKKEDVISEMMNGNVARGLWRKIFSTQVAKQLLFDEHLIVGEDSEWIIKAVSICERVQLIPDNHEYFYIKSDNSITRSAITNSKLLCYVESLIKSREYYLNCLHIDLLHNKDFLDTFCDLFFGLYLHFRKHGSTQEKERYDYIITYIKKNDVVKQYHPKNIKMIFKKILYCYFRPLLYLFKNKY